MCWGLYVENMEKLSVTTYAAFRKKIETTLILGQRKVEEAKVRTYWETGRLINDYLGRSENSNHEHGKKVVARLARDIGLGETVFYRCMQFAEKFPTFAARQKLSWAHYRALIAVPDEKQRFLLADKASQSRWSSRELEIEIRNLRRDERGRKTGDPSFVPLPVPAIGAFWTYKIIRPEVIHSFSQELLIDLGFSTALELNRVSDEKIDPGAIVTSSKDLKGHYSLTCTEDLPAEAPGDLNDKLYTYCAYVERVVDGDTLKVEIDLGFNIRVRQTIRLRAVDCPEMGTPAGEKAKRFVEGILSKQKSLVVRTHKSDKYDRYLGDVFYPGGTREWIYLNNRLLEEGLALRA